jgi:hypothetical protein
MTALQVALWFAAGATGISVIWSGLAGVAIVGLGIHLLVWRGRRKLASSARSCR